MKRTKDWKELWFDIKPRKKKEVSLPSTEKEIPVTIMYSPPTPPSPKEPIQFVSIETSFAQIFTWVFQVMVSVVLVGICLWSVFVMLLAVGCSMLLNH